MDFLKSIEKSRGTFPYEEIWFPIRIWRLFFGNMTSSNCTPWIETSGNLTFWMSEIRWSRTVSAPPPVFEESAVLPF